jgi:hypothetical protein
VLEQVPGVAGHAHDALRKVHRVVSGAAGWGSNHDHVLADDLKHTPQMPREQRYGPGAGGHHDDVGLQCRAVQAWAPRSSVVTRPRSSVPPSRGTDARWRPSHALAYRNPPRARTGRRRCLDMSRPASRVFSSSALHRKCGMHVLGCGTRALAMRPRAGTSSPPQRERGACSRYPCTHHDLRGSTPHRKPPRVVFLSSLR